MSNTRSLARMRADAPAFRERLRQLVACRTDRTAPYAAGEVARAVDLMSGWLSAAGFSIYHHKIGDHPFLIAQLFTSPDAPTLLTYSHGDVVPGMEGRWADGRDPWILTEAGGRLYGRGVADNKGQFLTNLTAIEAVQEAQDALGLNITWLIEMGEEIGSPGLAELCTQQAETLSADILLASDGPRVAADRPTLFLGARGGVTYRLDLIRRDGGRHSGNFGGALRNPALELAHALTTITDRTGALQIPAWTPGTIPPATRDALKGLTPAGGAIDPDWGAPGLTPAERIHAWSSAEILGLHAGDPPAPVNAIPPKATAWVQLRYAPGTDDSGLETALRDHLDAHGYADIQITSDGPAFRASATPVDHPAVAVAAASMKATNGQAPAILPSLGGSLPNDVFRDGLGLPTLWVPHSYPGCSQHAPDEHLPVDLFPDAAAIMAGLLTDIAAAGREALL